MGKVCPQYFKQVCIYIYVCVYTVYEPLRSAALMSKSWPPCRATASPSIRGRMVQMSLRASSKGSNSEGKCSGARMRPELPSRPCSLLGSGGTGMRSRVSGSMEGLRKGLGSWRRHRGHQLRFHKAQNLRAGKPNGVCGTAMMHVKLLPTEKTINVMVVNHTMEL